MAEQRAFDAGFITLPALFLVFRGVGFIGVLFGHDLSVAGTNVLSSSAGAVWTLFGTIVERTTDRTLVFTPTSDAKLYTVVTTCDTTERFGGRESKFLLVEGAVSEYTDGAVMGWVYYPGSAVALDASHLIQAPKAVQSVEA